MHTLHRIKRVKSDGTPKAGPAFRYEVRDEKGTVVDKRETDRVFIGAYSDGGRSWSYVGDQRGAMARAKGDIARLQISQEHRLPGVTPFEKDDRFPQS